MMSKSNMHTDVNTYHIHVYVLYDMYNIHINKILFNSGKRVNMMYNHITGSPITSSFDYCIFVQ